MAQLGMMFLILFVATTTSACQFLDELAPTMVAPIIRSDATVTSTPADQSPRVRSAQDVPPTWTPSAGLPNESPVAPQTIVTPPAGSQGSYTVQAGDTLAEIAIRYNVTLEALAAANNIEDFDHIEVGQVLIIP